MTVLDYIDNRMPLDESHLDSHIEEYIGGWVERKVFEKKLFIYLCTVPLFSATIPWLLQHHTRRIHSSPELRRLPWVFRSDKESP